MGLVGLGLVVTFAAVVLLVSVIHLVTIRSPIAFKTLYIALKM